MANPRKQLPFLNGVLENNCVFQKGAGKTVAEIGGEKAEIGGQMAEKNGIAFFGPQTIPFFVEGHLLEMPFLPKQVCNRAACYSFAPSVACLQGWLG